MNDILVDEHNFFRVKNKFVLCRTNLEYLQQKIKIALSFQRGEYFMDNKIGLPYIPDESLRKNEHLNLLLTSIQARIMKIEGIKKILSFNNEYKDNERKLYVSFVLQTEDEKEIEYKTKLNIGA